MDMMPANLCRRNLHRIFASVAFALAAMPALAQTQTPPATPGIPPAQNPVCARLESQLTAVDRGTADAARLDQLKRLEDAANKQQFELDRLVAQSHKAGC